MISVSSTGLLCIPIFYYVEKYSKYPMFPAQVSQRANVRESIYDPLD
jgi:hypothetical protein